MILELDRTDGRTSEWIKEIIRVDIVRNISEIIWSDLNVHVERGGSNCCSKGNFDYNLNRFIVHQIFLHTDASPSLFTLFLFSLSMSHFYLSVSLSLFLISAIIFAVKWFIIQF